jgi:hypothetical protein
MKKQLQRKISLNKETLRNLSGREMIGVAGGITATCCNSSDQTYATCGGYSCRHCASDTCTVDTNCC